MLFDILFGNAGWLSVVAGVIASLAAVFILLPVHEFAHAKTAVILGDNTPKYSGRLTLNPFAHIDYLGAALLILCGFGWAQPVGINIRNFKNPKRDMAITALAGPVSNLIMALIFCLISNFFFYVFTSTVFYIISVIFNYLAILSVSLAVFNIIPIPPLDGSRLLSALLPDRTYYRLMSYERYFSFIIIAVIIFLNRTGIFSWLVNGVLNAIQFIADLPFIFFVGLI